MVPTGDDSGKPAGRDLLRPTAPPRPVAHWCFAPYTSGTGPTFRLDFFDLTDDQTPTGLIHLSYRLIETFPARIALPLFEGDQYLPAKAFAPDADLLALRLLQQLCARLPAERVYLNLPQLRFWADDAVNLLTYVEARLRPSVERRVIAQYRGQTR